MRPCRLVHRGRLVPDAINDIGSQFTTMLHRIGVPFLRESESILIYGYTANPGALATQAEEDGGGQPATRPESK